MQPDPDLRDLWAAEAAKTTTEPNWPNRAMTLGKALPEGLITADGGFNDPRVLGAESPAPAASRRPMPLPASGLRDRHRDGAAF